MAEKQKKRNYQVAVKVESLSKTFKVPHEKNSTLKGAFVSLLNSSIKGYETFHALDGVNFEVKKGEFFGIIGRNGCGKSTLLKILAGIYIPDKGKGEVTINGKLSPFLELGVGFNNELTGRENIFLGGTILGLNRKQIAERYDRIVAFAELEEFIDMKLKNYSSGMQVRLAFALAINVEADILLMDEVLAVGDTNFQSKCLAEFNRYREMGKTVILVTHDIGTVQRYCDRAMLLRSGKVMMIGDPEEVGAAYMQQNMSDEESRLESEESVITDTDAKGKESKKAEIRGVEYFGADLTKKRVFETGDDLIIRVRYDINESVEPVNFGLALYNQEGSYVFGASTINDKIPTKEFVKNKYLQIRFNSIPLRADSYHIGFAIYGKNENVVYDYNPKLESFKVYSKDKNFGMVRLGYSWEVNNGKK